MPPAKKSILSNKPLIALGIFAFTFLLYTPSLNNGFVWDDTIDIERQYNRYSELDLKSYLFPDRREGRSAAYYRPMHHISYVWDYNLWGMNPLGFHLTNNLAYSLSTTLFYFLVLLILKEYRVRAKEYVALFSALYFAVHPMHVESVSWISGRTDVLCGLFFIAAFLFHLKAKERMSYLLLSVPMLYLSLLSKEVAVAFPFAIVAYELLKERSVSKRMLLSFAAYFAALGLYLYIRNRIIQGLPGLPEAVAVTGEPAVPSHPAGENGKTGAFAEYLSALKIMLGAYIYYFFKLIFPFTFNVFIERIPQSLPVIAASAGFISALAYGVYRSARYRSGLTAFCILLTGITLGPSVLVAVYSVAATPLAERYLFIPVAGVALFAGYWLLSLEKYRTVLYITVSLIFVSHIYLTFDRQDTWRDNVNFWGKAIEEPTYSAFPYLNYGIALVESEKLDEGISILKKAHDADLVRGSRLNAMIANNLGIAYMNKMDYEQAYEWFRNGITYDPGYVPPYFHLAVIHMEIAINRNSMIDFERAEQLLNRILEINSRYSRAWFLLAQIQVYYGDIETAKEYAREALRRGLVEPMHSQARAILEM